MTFLLRSFLLAIFGISTTAYWYDPELVQYNLNQNQSATEPTQYWGEWTGHQYTSSPTNWRFPFYTLFLDRFVNGDPTNDNINGTYFEHDLNSNQMRHGGDLQGLVDTLDYIQGMGIRGLYLAGSPFMNLPWEYDGYSPVDLSLLDQHFGTIAMWRAAIDEIHARNMYVVLDNTFATLSDLIGFDGYLNTTTPFELTEHQVQYKSGRHYHDFNIGNTYNKTCDYPKFWLETGYPVGADVTDQMVGCYDSDFDQYGDTEAFGVFPDWRRQLSKFASVQDRLREWHEPVRAKLENFYCMLISQLDVDGFRYDKATQSTVDAMGFMNGAMRTCARRFGKTNFFTPGEITGGNTFGAIYIGRGRQPDMLPETLTDAITMTNNSADQFFLREPENSALDAAAFHYTVYRTLTRFLGMDGNLEAGYDAPRNWVDMWNTFLITNDFVNSNTGEFDPRHMYGVTNQDVFRWPAIENGVNRQLLGLFIATIHLPGIPLLLWGEEQAFYVLDNTASNYIFGRQPMSSASAWQSHGCYHLDSTQYYKFPVEAARHGCADDTVGYDHRDPSAPVRNIIRHMYQLRETYPVLNDGFFLQQLSNQTEQIQYPGSTDVPTETGLWSVMRSIFAGYQDLSGSGQGDQPVWLVYSNANASTVYEFDCSNNDTALNITALIAPFATGTTVKNLFSPYDEHTLESSVRSLGINGSTSPNGCLSSLKMEAYDFRAYVPIDQWVAPPPMVTKFLPGHDARLQSSVEGNTTESVEIGFYFSTEMDCNDVTSSLTINSTTVSGNAPTLNQDSVKCSILPTPEAAPILGAVASVWSWSAVLDGVENGIHAVTVQNATASASGQSTGSTDRFLFRIGQLNNPMVFPKTGNYSTSLLTKDSSGSLIVSHSAAGADLWRYSTNWGTSFSHWMSYQGENVSIESQPWTGTNRQEWKGEHVRVEYWSRLAGSSDHIQEGDLEEHKPRRFPHLFLNGPYNEYGYDAGLDNQMHQNDDGLWERHFMTEWPAVAQINVWGMDPDGKPDQTYVMGDADGDSVLDRLPPSSLSSVILNITRPPPMPYLAWSFKVNDGDMRFQLIPSGSMYPQLALFILLWILPVLFGGAAIWAFMQSFYKVKFNQIGISEKTNYVALAIKENYRKLKDEDHIPSMLMKLKSRPKFQQPQSALVNADQTIDRRTVLIATMEYDIEDWAIKIKIGGLGVMAQLMGKNLGHQDLIWVVPCVGGVDYPVDRRAEPMNVTILGTVHEVQVQYHTLRNITYVLLDAPTFRQQSKAEPYPARMDDLESAIYYSAWNQCIAQAVQRFPIDLYHINDYHGCVAPLYLLPKTIPVALSLHNAEFQGLWPMRTKKEAEEVASVYNLSVDVVERYVQFGQVFNLLHAGASYLRIHQQGFGAVGVSKKYGSRSYVRYPIFWGLKKVGKLPNPDPSDTADWNKDLPADADIRIDQSFEAARPELKRQAQEWAGLEQNPKAELFVFVGRWSMQKGIDLIADVFPAVLDAHKDAQLICIGPVIDLYGKFAALKLEWIMKQYPGRVCSKPVFTALPPFIFSGAEFALIPSRDEPFGLVAVEFGRKGALGVGARVGGLGQMPGWWYTVEAVTTSHLLHQFRLAIDEALSSKTEVRAIMRARSAKQRFPVAQWVEDLGILQSTAIRIHRKVGAKHTDDRTSIAAMPPAYMRAKQTPGHTDDSMIRNSVRDSTASYLHLDAPLDSPGFASPLGTPRRGSFDPPRSPALMDSEVQLLRAPDPNEIRARMESLIPPSAPFMGGMRSPSASVLSFDSVVGEKKDFKLQKVDPFFTDSNGFYYQEFEKRLSSVQKGSLDSKTCIEEYLVKSEKKWFEDFRHAKLGRVSQIHSAAGTPLHTPFRTPNPSYPASLVDEDEMHEKESDSNGSVSDEFLLGADYTPPTGLTNWMQHRIGDWPVYSFLIALGQIISANSYQMTLLTGEVGQSADKVYIISSVYLVASICWWFLFRKAKSVVCLSVPFFFYGLAFILIGVAHYGSSVRTRGWIQNTGTGFYAFASASGSIFFALNFGDEGGAPVRAWVFRACVIQGTQQIGVVALWFWGSYLSRGLSNNAVSQTSIAETWKILAITLPIAALLWTVGALLWFGLPNYYRQAPGKIPSFYTSLIRRKIVLWFIVTVIIQNFFLSAQYGRSWAFLWSSNHAPWWQVLLLVIFFFVFVWAGVLWGFSILSTSHSWILPIFAIGLGAPRWAQIWWGTSNIGQFLPWVPGGGYATSALWSRALWLWLGVLDTTQGVGLGMILLGTLTRIHVAFTLITAQIIGAAVTAFARAFAPNNIGPGPISPDFSGGLGSVWQPWFWIGLTLNLLVCAGYFLFFRKEQLSKP